MFPYKPSVECEAKEEMGILYYTDQRNGSTLIIIYSWQKKLKPVIFDHRYSTGLLMLMRW